MYRGGVYPQQRQKNSWLTHGPEKGIQVLYSLSVNFDMLLKSLWVISQNTDI